MAELKFEITETLGTIGEGSKGWKKELNLVSWNDRKEIEEKQKLNGK